jgi:hypothetical protein
VDGYLHLQFLPITRSLTTGLLCSAQLSKKREAGKR